MRSCRITSTSTSTTGRSSVAPPLHREASLSQVLGRWKRLEDKEADLLKRARPTKKFVSRFAEYRSSFLRRMWNSSAFMRTFKQQFTMSFNGCCDHRGTMFERRYHERNHKPEPEGSDVSVSLDSYICGDETDAAFLGSAAIWR